MAFAGKALVSGGIVEVPLPGVLGSTKGDRLCLWDVEAGTLRQRLSLTGDRVLFGKYSSSEIKIDGEDLLIMREDEILGIITRAGAVAGGKKSK